MLRPRIRDAQGWCRVMAFIAPPYSAFECTCALRCLPACMAGCAGLPISARSDGAQLRVSIVLKPSAIRDAFSEGWCNAGYGFHRSFLSVFGVHWRGYPPVWWQGQPHFESMYLWHTRHGASTSRPLSDPIVGYLVCPYQNAVLPVSKPRADAPAFLRSMSSFVVTTVGKLYICRWVIMCPNSCSVQSVDFSAPKSSITSNSAVSTRSNSPA